jgi:hypothetical protein
MAVSPSQFSISQTWKYRTTTVLIPLAGPRRFGGGPLHVECLGRASLAGDSARRRAKRLGCAAAAGEGSAGAGEGAAECAGPEVAV